MSTALNYACAISKWQSGSIVLKVGERGGGLIPKNLDNKKRANLQIKEILISINSFLLFISFFPLPLCFKVGGRGDLSQKYWQCNNKIYVSQKSWEEGATQWKFNFLCVNLRKMLICCEKIGEGGASCIMSDATCLTGIHVTLYIIQMHETLRLKTYCCKFNWSINQWLSFLISQISLHVYWNACTCDNSINTAP